MSGQEKCTGTTLAGVRCGSWPVTGQRVCGKHGGQNVPVAATAAAEKAMRSLRALRDPVESIRDPLSEILQVAGRARRLMELMEERCAVLQDVRYAGQNGEQTRAELMAYERSLDRLAKFLEAIMRLNIEERMVRVSERQADVVVVAVRAALRAVNVLPGTPEWVDAGKAAAHELRLAAKDQSPNLGPATLRNR